MQGSERRLVCSIANSPQNRHPERRASHIYRVTQHLWRGVEGPRRCSSYPCRSELFDAGVREEAGLFHLQLPRKTVILSGAPHISIA
jgi:hypothetical protein